MTLDEFAQVVIERLHQLPEGMSDVSFLDWCFAQPGLVPRWGTWCEFGVHQAKSLALIANHRGDARVWGFDSFEGLPEDWRNGFPRGTFKLKNPPALPAGAEGFIVGRFEKTLGGDLFTSLGGQPVTFAHVDCDLYSSAKTVLTWLDDKLIDGSIIVFDELMCQPWDNGEMRALHETNLKFEWIGWSRQKAAIRIVRHD